MNSTFRNITLHVLFYHWWIYSPTPFLISPTSLHVSSFPLFSPPLLLSLAPSLLSPGLPIHCPSSHNRRTNRTKKNQYTSTLRNFVPNLPVSAILVIPVSRPAASYYSNILIQVLGLIFQNIQHISLPNSKWRFILDVLLGFCSNAQDYPYRTSFFQTLQNKIKTAICLYIKITINLIYQYNWTTSVA